jgi:hypothetical protein
MVLTPYSSASHLAVAGSAKRHLSDGGINCSVPDNELYSLPGLKTPPVPKRKRYSGAGKTWSGK